MTTNVSNARARSTRPFIVGIGGGVSSGSSTERALEIALSAAEAYGARTQMLGASHIMALPLFLTAGSIENAFAIKLIAAVRAADGLILASPGYHGTVSGAVKNAIDFIEETARDARPYLTDLPVGTIATAGGHQAAMGTLTALRSITHALRGWPTPLGVAINSRVTPIVDGVCADLGLHKQLQIVGQQVVSFACSRD